MRNLENFTSSRYIAENNCCIINKADTVPECKRYIGPNKRKNILDYNTLNNDQQFIVLEFRLQVFMK